MGSIFAILLGFNLGAFADDLDPAIQYIENIKNQALANLANADTSSRQLAFCQMVDRDTHWKPMSDYALGTYRNQVSDQDRSILYPLFRNMIATYFSLAFEKMKGSGIEIHPRPIKSGDDRIVRVAIKSSGEAAVDVRFVIRPSEDGLFRIYNAKVNGIDLLVMQQSQIDAVAKRAIDNGTAVATEIANSLMQFRACP